MHSEAQSTAINGMIEAFTSLPPLTKCRIRRIDEQEYIATTAPPEHTPMDSNLEGRTGGEGAVEERVLSAVVAGDHKVTRHAQAASGTRSHQRSHQRPLNGHQGGINGHQGSHQRSHQRPLNGHQGAIKGPSPAPLEIEQHAKQRGVALGTCLARERHEE